MRVVYSPLDALQLARREPRPPGGVLRHRLRDDRAGQRDDRLPGQAARACGNFSLLVSHVLRAAGDRGDHGVAALPGAGVPGRRPRVQRDGHGEYPPLAERYRVPIVVTGFEPLDILEGIRRTVAAAGGGPARGARTPTRGRCRAEGNPAAQAMLRDVFEVTDRAWRGIGMIPRQRLAAVATRYRDFDAERRFDVGGIHTDESAICRSGEVLQGLIKPHECAAFGKQCTPRNPLGATMVSLRGRLRRLLPLPPARAARAVGGQRPWLSRRHRPAAPVLDFEGWTCPVPLRDTPTVVMGHGGGGAMSAELVEHLFLPAFGARPRGARRLRRPRRRRRPAGLLHRLVRGEAAVLPRRLDRRPGGQRHRQRPGDVRGARRCACRPRSSSRRARRWPTSAGSRRRSARRRGGRRPAGHRRHQGRRRRPRRRRVRQHRRHRRWSRTASTSARAGRGPATSCSSAATSACTAWP